MCSFLQVQMFSYQCSQYSTPESIVEAFDLAKEFQEKRNTTEYVSVVVLDEVGLAEDSPTLPLKVLHPLLEDGTEGGDSAQQVCLDICMSNCMYTCLTLFLLLLVYWCNHCRPHEKMLSLEGVVTLKFHPLLPVGSLLTSLPFSCASVCMCIVHVRMYINTVIAVSDQRSCVVIQGYG